MSNTINFPHLHLPLLHEGKPKFHGGGKKSQKTQENINNRRNHGNSLKRRSSELSRFWTERRETLSEENLSEITLGIPVLLEIDPASDVEFLRGLGFEIICEIENGFIIVASEDINFSTLNNKLDNFIEEVSKRCNSPAKIYALCEDNDRLKRILSNELFSKWSTISSDLIYIVDIGISCCGNVKLPDPPKQKVNKTDEHFAQRKQNYINKFNEAYQKWDNLKIEREELLEIFIRDYHGEIIDMIDGTSTISELPDSFSARLKISGKCLRDLVMNFPYIFEVTEQEDINSEIYPSNHTELTERINILSPLESDPVICIIDSGIQEQHKYLASAIIETDSYNLVPNSLSSADEVAEGGHGTRVAGAVLYPNSIPINGTYQLPCWIRNLKVLDTNNTMPEKIYPPAVISKAVKINYQEKNIPTKIFNHSIGYNKPCEIKHMSAWAAEIDSQSYHNDVLFIQAAGNIHQNLIRDYLQKGYSYPTYLKQKRCRISDPAQSLQALTVGSISHSDFETDDIIALGKKNAISSFSRSGPGIWDTIKPEVVEYGGTHAYNKNSNPPILSTPPEVCPELIRKSPQGPAFSKDTIGTSFAAPKVTHIAAQLEKFLPESPALLYRALIAQSAHWPHISYELTNDECISLLRQIGYGIPDVSRATGNNEYRITLITPELMELEENNAHIFQIPIPEELSSIGEDYDILIEITLSYAANPRRTRRHIKGYLSTWLDWRCSKIGEQAEIFAQRIFQTNAAIDDEGNFNWVIGERTNRGQASGFSRTKGTLQKDWCIIKSNQLSDAFCIAVRAHKGWGSLFKAKYSLVVSFEAINQDIRIYEPIKTALETTIENQEIEIELPNS